MINFGAFCKKKNGEPYSRCFCTQPELIENYDKAIKSEKLYDCHHRLETHFSDGTPRPKNAQLSMKELIALDDYYNVSPNELIFLEREEHISLHNNGRLHSKEFSKKCSERMKGVPKSEEWCKKHSESIKGHKVSEETKKKMSEAKKGCSTGPKSEITKKRLSKSVKKTKEKIRKAYKNENPSHLSWNEFQKYYKKNNLL